MCVAEVRKAIMGEIAGTLRGSMANVSDDMDETIGDVLADLHRLKRPGRHGSHGSDQGGRTWRRWEL